MQKINVRNLLRMQKAGQTIRPLHIILGNRNLEKFGEIVNIPADSITYHPQFNAVDELSFNIYRERNGEIERLWEKIIDFKTVYVKEYNEWFEITVGTGESEKNTKKLITAKSLCEAELGQVILHDIEINTEGDIAREEYTEPTIFYNHDKKDSSLLNRIFEKVPGYTIAHVDETLLKIQRSFSIDGTSVYDFLTTTLSQEIGCIFLFDSNTRSVYVYDMETCCLSCGYRSEDSFTVCPECGGTIIHEPYGKDTSIFIDKNNLGSDIQLTSETDSIKNCFRVIGGDDLINATLKNINPNGSNYIYYFNNDILLDMPNELQDKIKSYDELVNEYTSNKSFSLEASLVNQYNNIIEYIKTYYPETTYSSIQQQYNGWSNITSVYYNIIDLYSYLNSSMMPTWKQQDKTAASQLALLTPSNLSPVAVTDVSKISVYTANNAVLAMAKAIIDTSIYKVEILDGSTLKSQTWTGRFKLTSYSDKEDTAEMKTAISITINDDYIAYVNQQVDKAMGKANDQGLQEIYKIESLDTFKIELHKYSAQRLTSYQSAYQTAINVLTEQGVASESSNLHNSIYIPYYERFIALESELSYRNSQLDTITGLEKYIEDLIYNTHNKLDFKSYIGEKYWKLFTYYRREDDYSNDNYISDGLTNTELIDKANELLVVAKKELVKSGEKQFTISGTLQNLLLLTDKDGNRIFEPILDDFTLGNFIRTKIDGKIYVMRLADISISYGDLSKLSVTFSDVYRYGSSNVNIVKDILAKSQSMASSYSSTTKQASQGEKANLTFEKLQKEGLDSALYSVHNTNSTAIFDEHGILIRSYDDVLDDYKDEQARINVNEFIYTTNRWRTAVTAFGKQTYTLNGTTYEKYGLNTDFVISGLMIAGDIYSANYTTDSKGTCTAGTHINLNDGSFVFAGGNLKYDNNELYVNGKITAISGKIGKYNITNSYLSTGTDSTCTGLGGNQAFWAGSENSNNAPFRVDYNGYMYANNVDISGKINANDGKIGGWNIDSSTIYQDYDKYRVYIQNPSSPETWVLSCQENKNNSYYGNWYVRADGYMYASKGQIGNFTIDNGTLVTYQKNGVKGISMNQNYINFYSWVDDYENYVGSITTTKYYTNNGETRRALTLNADYGDVVGINCTKEKTGNTEYEFVVRINDDLNKSLEFFSPNISVNGGFQNNIKTPTTLTIYCYNPNSGKDTQNVRITNTDDRHYENCELSVYGSAYIGYDLRCFGSIYGTIASDSDKDIKKDICLLDLQKSSEFIYSLKPCEFKMINGTSDRYHHGFIAQQVKETMKDDWGLFIDKKVANNHYVTHISDANGNIQTITTARYALRYDEFIADIVATLQLQNDRIVKLENNIIKEE